MDTVFLTSCLKFVCVVMLCIITELRHFSLVVADFSWKQSDLRFIGHILRTLFSPWEELRKDKVQMQ